MRIAEKECFSRSGKRGHSLDASRHVVDMHDVVGGRSIRDWEKTASGELEQWKKQSIARSIHEGWPDNRPVEAVHILHDLLATTLALTIRVNRTRRLIFTWWMLRRSRSGG